MNRTRIEALRSDGIGVLALARLATKALPHALQTRTRNKPVMDEIQVVTIARYLSKREYGNPVADVATVIIIMTDVLLERKRRLDNTPDDIEVTLREYVDRHRLLEDAYVDAARAFAFVRSTQFGEAEVAASALWL